MRVLVVEDEPATALSIAETVRGFGYAVDVAGDVPTAWSRLNAVDTPIVLTDWHMEGEDGMDLCRRIRSTPAPSYTYIIFLTRLSERKHVVEGLSAGADDFIGKPFDPDELRVRLLAAERIIKLETRLREANEALQMRNEMLHESSRTDALMQIGNRAAFDEMIERVHERARQDAGRYAVVMCDLDCFKRYNDTFGHQTGDEVLRRVAASIKLGIRATDWAFRYGGEEIALLLDGHNLESAGGVAERVRMQVESLRFTADRRREPFGVTISCGVGSCPENSGPTGDWRCVVAAADRALYAAKRTGRNRTVILRPGEAEIAPPSASAPEAERSRPQRIVPVT